MAKAKAKAKRRRGLVRRLAEIAATLILAVIGWAALYAVIAPPTTALIEMERARLGEIRRAPLDFDALPGPVRLAFPAAEDARFCGHWGVDPEAVRAALQEAEDGERLRGGSTLTQQVAKNAFLWPGRSWLRKGLEAGFSVLIELIWSKRRILEVYLSVAEMGEGVFGLEAAARAHFGKSAPQLTLREAALIAAALPDPRDRNPARPSGFLDRRAADIARGARTLAADGRGACVLD